MLDISTFVCPPAIIYVILTIALACFFIAYGLFRGSFNSNNIFENVAWLSSQFCATVLCCMCLTFICTYNKTAAWIIVAGLIMSALASCISIIIEIAIKQNIQK